MARSYQDKDLKLLFGQAAARCAFPACRAECILEASEADPAAVVGQVAHIVGYGTEGKVPRKDPNFPKADINKYVNLILLCPTHHAIVDAHDSTHTIDDLRLWKNKHEQWVREALAEAMPTVTFSELEMVSSVLLAGFSAEWEETFVLTDPREKMRRNGLSQKVDFWLKTGLMNAREVGRFVSHMAEIYIDYPERLKAGFILRYREHQAQGLDGDSLFESLHQFSHGNSRNFSRQAAGLSVLAYLFEKCEVFEP